MALNKQQLLWDLLNATHQLGVLGESIIFLNNTGEAGTAGLPKTLRGALLSLKPSRIVGKCGIYLRHASLL